MNKLQQMKTYEMSMLDSMSQCVSIMREILLLIKEEQQAILKSDAQAMKTLLDKRLELTEELHIWREKLTASIWVIKKISLMSSYEELSWEQLLEQLDFEDTHIVILKDQLLALSDRIERLNKSNSYWLQKSIEYQK